MNSVAISEETENFSFLNNPSQKDQCIFIAPIFESVCGKAHLARGTSCLAGSYKDLIL